MGMHIDSLGDDYDDTEELEPSKLPRCMMARYWANEPARIAGYLEMARTNSTPERVSRYVSDKYREVKSRGRGAFFIYNLETGESGGITVNEESCLIYALDRDGPFVSLYGQGGLPNTTLPADLWNSSIREMKELHPNKDIMRRFFELTGDILAGEDYMNLVAGVISGRIPEVPLDSQTP